MGQKFFFDLFGQADKKKNSKFQSSSTNNSLITRETFREVVHKRNEVYFLFILGKYSEKNMCTGITLPLTQTDVWKSCTITVFFKTPSNFKTAFDNKYLDLTVSEQ